MSNNATLELVLNPTESGSFSKAGVQHIRQTGSLHCFCGQDLQESVIQQSDSTYSQIGSTLVAPDYATCGKCSDAFWEAYEDQI